MVKSLPAMSETRVRFLGWEDSLGKGVTTHSSILAWRIPWSEEPGRLQSIYIQTLSTSLVTQMVKRLLTMWETQVWSPGREDPLEKAMAPHSSILAWKIPLDGGSWWATVPGFAKSWTRLHFHFMYIIHGVTKSRTWLSDFHFTLQMVDR